MLVDQPPHPLSSHIHTFRGNRGMVFKTFTAQTAMAKWTGRLPPAFESFIVLISLTGQMQRHFHIVYHFGIWLRAQILWQWPDWSAAGVLACHK